MKKKSNEHVSGPTIHGIPQRLRDYWNRVFSSTRPRMPRGAWNINKIISWAKKDNWRRGKEKKKH